MALDFGGVPNQLFDASQEDNLGIGAKGKESFWSCGAANFTTDQPDVRDILNLNSLVRASANGIPFSAPVSLPNKATITAAVVYGNAGASAETWILLRVDHATNTSPLAGANIGTEDKTIARTVPGNEIVDNEKYSYVFTTNTLDTGDEIYGARITYTI